jgi:hypothetical protein
MPATTSRSSRLHSSGQERAPRPLEPVAAVVPAVPAVSVSAAVSAIAGAPDAVPAVPDAVAPPSVSRPRLPVYSFTPTPGLPLSLHVKCDDSPARVLASALPKPTHRDLRQYSLYLHELINWVRPRSLTHLCSIDRIQRCLDKAAELGVVPDPFKFHGPFRLVLLACPLPLPSIVVCCSHVSKGGASVEHRCCLVWSANKCLPASQHNIPRRPWCGCILLYCVVGVCLVLSASPAVLPPVVDIRGVFGSVIMLTNVSHLLSL